MNYNRVVWLELCSDFSLLEVENIPMETLLQQNIQLINSSGKDWRLWRLNWVLKNCLLLLSRNWSQSWNLLRSCLFISMILPDLLTDYRSWPEDWGSGWKEDRLNQLLLTGQEDVSRLNPWLLLVNWRDTCRRWCPSSGMIMIALLFRMSSCSRNQVLQTFNWPTARTLMKMD